MQVQNTFSVEAPLEKVWAYLLDVPSVAPCVPNAKLTEVAGDNEFKGTVKVKLGPVEVNYRGTLILKDINQDRHTLVLDADGTDARGSGGASGTVTSMLTADGPSRTIVTMNSEITVTGKVAQFGRNIMQDVSNKLIKDFAKCLEANINAASEAELTGEATVTAEANAATPGAVAVDSEQSDTAPMVEPVSPVARAARPVHQPAADIKLLPIVLDITKSRVARGLRKLAQIVEPDEKS